MKKLMLLFVPLLSLCFFSCTKDHSSTSAGSTAHVTVNMTDAPGAFDAVLLNIKSVVVVTDKATTTLNVNGGIVNILNYRSGRDTVLAGQDIPAGTIEQIRLVLNDGNQVIVDGVVHDLTTPSGQTSGVKLNLHETLTAGIDYTITLDFDAAQSIVLTGNGKYILKPVIRAIAQAASGAISGTISPAASSPKVYAINGTDTIGTIADTTGKFYFPGLSAGTYQVKFVPVSPYATKIVTGVTVTNGAVTNMGTVDIAQ